MKPMLLLVALCLLAPAAEACTIVVASDGDDTWVGNNEDWSNPFTKAWVVPPSEGEYGRICFGFDAPFSYVQGGMNDQGLFCDANMVPETGWTADPQKSALGDPVDRILAECATVEEAVRFCGTHNIPLGRARFPIADASGDAVILEWGREGLGLVRKEGSYLISTNFVASNYTPGTYPCDRYRIAETLLASFSPITSDHVRAVLSATHSEGDVPTIYSDVYDLRRRVVHIYNFHDFEQGMTISLAEAIAAGRQSFDLPRLFPIVTHTARIFYNRRLKDSVRAMYEHAGGSEARDRCQRLRDRYRAELGFLVGEDELNHVGYALLGEEAFGAAVEIFRLNVEEHPDSWNAHDSLGEAYVRMGDEGRAAESYRRSLELNPYNRSAQKQLERLGE